MGNKIISQNFDNGMVEMTLSTSEKFYFGPMGERKFDEVSKAQSLRNFFNKMIENSNALVLFTQSLKQAGM